MSAWDRRPDALSPGWDVSLPPRVPSGSPAPLGSLDGPGQDFAGSQHSAIPQGSCLPQLPICQNRTPPTNFHRSEGKEQVLTWSEEEKSRQPGSLWGSLMCLQSLVRDQRLPRLSGLPVLPAGLSGRLGPLGTNPHLLSSWGLYMG